MVEKCEERKMTVTVTVMTALIMSVANYGKGSIAKKHAEMMPSRHCVEGEKLKRRRKFIAM